MATKLDKDTTKPSRTDPGDGPADTTDPNESAQSAPTDPDVEARKVGTVNAVKPAPQPETPARTAKDRTEKYKATRPDGTVVTVVRNVESGEATVRG